MDKVTVRELQLYIDNDADLYRSQYTPILKNLMTKHGQGRYNSQTAVKLWMYLVDNGAKKYSQDHGHSGAVWHKMFPKALRLKVAAALRDDFEDEAKLGNYDNLLPKKYQGKVSGKTLGEASERSGAIFTDEQREVLEGSVDLAEAKDVHVAQSSLTRLAAALAKGDGKNARYEFKDVLQRLGDMIDAEGDALGISDSQARSIYRALVKAAKSI